MPSSRARPIVAAAILLLAAACTSGRLKREAASALAMADGRVLEGCYDCLLQARQSYEGLASSKYAKRDTLALRLFETNVLVALRAKEMQLDWTPELERARALVSRVPATVDAARVLRIAEAVLPDGNGRGSGWPAPLRRATAAFAPKVPDEVAWLNTAPLRSAVREYLALALDCSYDARVLAPTRQPGATARRPVLSPDATPLVIYRTGICMGADTNMLAAVMALVPDFHEAAYYHATSSAFGAELDGGTAAWKLLDRAYRRFPTSPGVTFMSGWLASNLGDCSTADRWFGETIAIDSTHEFALLLGTKCLSGLHRDSAAVAMATRLLDLQTASTQQAYYWRALSRFRLKELGAARSDIDAAKSMAHEPNSLTLGGIIENEQDDLAIAEQDLRAARALPRGELNCPAAWTLGLVLDKQKRPVDAGDAFEGAMECFDFRVLLIRHQIDTLLARPSRNPAHTQRRAAALAADSTEQRARYFVSAFNAAGQRANTRRFDRALELLEVAGRDSTLAESVTKLRQAIVAIRSTR
jgi:hypothetical protein